MKRSISDVGNKYLLAFVNVSIDINQKVINSFVEHEFWLKPESVSIFM